MIQLKLRSFSFLFFYSVCNLTYREKDQANFYSIVYFNTYTHKLYIMQFTKTAVAAFIALINLVAADSEEFGLLSIHSASGAHMLVLQDTGNGLILSSSSTSFSGTVTDAGKLKFTNGKYAVVGTDGSVTDGAEADATTGFGLASGRLTLNGNTGFYAIADGNDYKLSTKQSGDATSIVLSARTTTGGTAADFSASGAKAAASSAAAPAAATTAAPAAAVSQIGDGQVQANTKTTVAAVSQINDGQVQANTKTTVAPVSQIGDGQIQAAKTTVAPVSQIGDGQIQAAKSTVAAVSQITDGQVQAAHSIQVQSENGVARLAMNGAGVIAAAVALLI